eukprot:scaffold1132_cov238-Pinguiococcus_pyrenoidosus.AAC.1
MPHFRLGGFFSLVACLLGSDVASWAAASLHGVVGHWRVWILQRRLLWRRQGWCAVEDGALEPTLRDPQLLGQRSQVDDADEGAFHGVPVLLRGLRFLHGCSLLASNLPPGRRLLFPEIRKRGKSGLRLRVDPVGLARLTRPLEP